METIKSLRNDKNRRALIQKTALWEYQTTCFITINTTNGTITIRFECGHFSATFTFIKRK